VIHNQDKKQKTEVKLEMIQIEMGNKDFKLGIIMLMKKKKVDTIYDFFKDKASQQNRSQLFQ
jgi:hypothetical protein